MNYCNECTHHYQIFLGDPKCKHESVVRKDLTGNVVLPLCETLRLPFATCGIHGKLFERRIEVVREGINKMSKYIIKDLK